jgi:hypothetical protein
MLRAIAWCVALLALTPLAGAGDHASGSARADEVASKKRAGVPVTVTKEMRGAGIVSSGIALPPIPPVTGNRKSPVPS